MIHFPDKFADICAWKFKVYAFSLWVLESHNTVWSGLLHGNLHFAVYSTIKKFKRLFDRKNPKNRKTKIITFFGIQETLRSKHCANMAECD